MDGSYPSINLVKTRVLLRTQDDIKTKRITLISVIVVGIYLTLLSTVVGVRYSFSKKITSLDAQIAQMSSQISAFKTRESKYRLISQKLTAMVQLLSDRAPIEPLIKKISSLMPLSISIDSILFGDSSDVLTVSVIAPDVFEVEALFSSLDNAIGEDFSKISVLSTKRSDDGTYGLLLEFYFNE